MRKASQITCLWPGLFRLWCQGDMLALPVAIAFGVVLNVVLAATFVFSSQVSDSWLLCGWVTVTALWGGGLWRGLQQRTASATVPQAQNQQDLFIRAQTEYLRGHWVETQSLLEQLIRRNPGDVESHLLLSSVYRRTRRIDLSRRELRRLQSFEGASHWRFEIARELAGLERASATGV